MLVTGLLFHLSNFSSCLLASLRSINCLSCYSFSWSIPSVIIGLWNSQFSMTDRYLDERLPLNKCVLNCSHCSMLGNVNTEMLSVFMLLIRTKAANTDFRSVRPLVLVMPREFDIFYQLVLGIIPSLDTCACGCFCLMWQRCCVTNWLKYIAEEIHKRRDEQSYTVIHSDVAHTYIYYMYVRCVKCDAHRAYI